MASLAALIAALAVLPVAASLPPPVQTVTCATVTTGCFHNSDPASHVATFSTNTSNATMASALCCAACNHNSSCAHWQLTDFGGALSPAYRCNLRTSDVRVSTGNGCIRSNNTGPPPFPPPPPPSPPTKPPLGFKPHIIFFMGDDAGFYNFGFRNNPEARTPNMDSLVDAGVLLDQAYVYKYCSPTRSSFLSGRLPIHVNQANRGVDDAGGVDLRMTTVADKLSSAGYACHQVGKWHAGSSAVANLPIYRGFNSSLGYLGGMEDHYTQQGSGGVDLWQDDAPAYGSNGTYGAFMYTNRSRSIIMKHDPSTPLFLYHAWQETHTPNEVPAQYVSPKINFPLRATYEGMAHCLDEGIGNITEALKQRGMLEQTLIVFSSDNGGREDLDFGGNNYPLRGMKFTDFQGGVRVASFASGGVVPAAMRGKTAAGIVHVTDWYHTFSYLAGVDPYDHRGFAQGMPPIDSLNVWPVVSQGQAGPRTGTPFALSSNALLAWPYKIVTSSQGGKGWWTGPVHPNGTKVKDSDPGCPKGCLFNVMEDPGEHTDLSDALPAVKSNLTTLLGHAISTSYQTNETPGYTKCTTSKEFVRLHHGFLGPICTAS